MRILLALITALVLAFPAAAATTFERRLIWDGTRWYRVIAPPDATRIRCGDGNIYILFDVCGQQLVGKPNLYNVAPHVPQ